MSDQAKCPTCQGRGHYEDYEGGEMVRCDACNGTGHAPVDTSEPRNPPSDEVGLCPWCGTMKHLNHIGLCGRCYDPTADSTGDELTQIVNENVNAMIAAYNAGESGFDWEPMVNAITKLQREAVVAALERVKKHKYWVSGDPANPFVSHDVIDAEIERFTAK